MPTDQEYDELVNRLSHLADEQVRDGRMFEYETTQQEILRVRRTQAGQRQQRLYQEPQNFFQQQAQQPMQANQEALAYAQMAQQAQANREAMSQQVWGTPQWGGGFVQASMPQIRSTWTSPISGLQIDYPSDGIAPPNQSPFVYGVAVVVTNIVDDEFRGAIEAFSGPINLDAVKNRAMYVTQMMYDFVLKEWLVQVDNGRFFRERELFLLPNKPEDCIDYINKAIQKVKGV